MIHKFALHINPDPRIVSDAIAWFTSGPEANILPTTIFSKVKLGTTPDIIALATIIILMVTTGAMVAAIFMNRQEWRRATNQERAGR